MEEDLGYLQRADDLRRYSIEEQQEVPVRADCLTVVSAFHLCLSCSPHLPS